MQWRWNRIFRYCKVTTFNSFKLNMNMVTKITKNHPIIRRSACNPTLLSSFRFNSEQFIDVEKSFLSILLIFLVDAPHELHVTLATGNSWPQLLHDFFVLPPRYTWKNRKIVVGIGHLRKSHTVLDVPMSSMQFCWRIWSAIYTQIARLNRRTFLWW